ncbi:MULTISPECIES: helix-turn-helix transcriptional regulator [Candidatus Regiella]|uniref:Transcriptional regulator n=1 Tax=Candidatus Regiella insecticola TaxID=138073 RepID=A0A6L2ZSJ0_9ENTR|nr:sigma-70 region 4 domain-containing protein [Candidatus Regiella insecticola]GFN47304.1 transcriptional regulator [Candidatus Regiella insecticola]
MTAFDPTQFIQFHKVFSELSVAQSETVLLFAIGIPYEDIADFRHISVKSVRRHLHESMKKLSIFSLNSLRSVIIIRLFLFTFNGISAGQ